jgi:uncharacterized spore protein YtfJ
MAKKAKKAEKAVTDDIGGGGGAGRRAGPLAAFTGLADRLGGARLCYGDPIRDGVRTVVPVARVRAAGGGGWGRDETSGGGGGGGGRLDARPIGFIEVGPDGTRFEAIHDPEALTRTLRAATAAAITVATAVAGLRAARHGGRLLGSGSGRRGAARLLGRGD